MPIAEREIDGRDVPGPLVLVQAVVNTRFSRSRPDDWQSVEQLRNWFIEHELLAEDTPVTQGDLRRMIELREALRALLRANNIGAPPPLEQIEILNHLAGHAPLILHFQQEGRAELVPDISGVEEVICLLLGDIFTAMADGSWRRLKACRNEYCGKAFYDSSKNRTGTWCNMARCGSRIKARAYRQRLKTQ